MKRVFATNLLLLLGINILVKPFYIFGIDREVQNTVGPEVYGLFFALVNFTYLFQILNDFGLQNFNNRELSRHPDLFSKNFPSLLLVKCALSICFLAVLLGAGAVTGYLTLQPLWLIGIGINQALLSVLLFIRSNLTGLGKYRADSLLSSADKLLMILIVGSLLLLRNQEFTILYFIVSQTISLLVVIAVATGILWPHLQGVRLIVRKSLSLWAIRSSLPYALVMFLMYLYTYIDGVMIERLHPRGALEAGIYASGYRLLDAVSIVGYLFAGLLLPMFSRQIKAGDSIRPLLEMGAKNLWSLAVCTSVATFFYGGEISEWLYSSADETWGVVLGRLMLSFLPWSMTYIYGTLLTAAGMLGAMNRLFVLCIILNAGANLMVIPKYGAAGVALTTLATQSLAALGQFALANRRFKELRTSALPLQALALLLLVFLSTWILHTFTNLPWTIGMIASVTAAGALSVVLKMISPKEWFELVKSKQVE